MCMGALLFYLSIEGLGKGLLFLSNKRVRGWTLGWGLTPCKTLLKNLPGNNFCSPQAF